MSIDERIEFLVKSSESLHASSQELHASMRELHASVRELRVTVEGHTKQIVEQAESIRQLALIAASHGDRISTLERQTGT